ncbi:nitrilase-related carbon-nitrogen hydrolase [Pseudomonas typographi]|uniref:nitrilase-related carbon-nitrogen hydrolase n=1 Tax=Pseudomonas typographi TaxID=2715964 RepID=UPI00168257DB|nr:nitrilase-related carbon-nitrogen hydrolase [Pseudomonas typographi]MBD1588210.1 carbon-nitrogen hydrolase [Pseudomonas typographi]
MKVGIAQLDHSPLEAEQALQRVYQALDALPDCDMVVFPELALCGYADPAAIRRLAEPAAGPTLLALAQQARRRGQALVFGYAERSGERLFNAAQVIDGRGEVLANYRKVHLWGGHETELFAPGQQLQRFELDGLRFGLLVCYDLDFPEASRALAVAGIDVLLCLSATTVGYEVVPQALVPARAYENNCFAVFANRGEVHGPFACVGQSRIVRPDGHVLAGVAGAGAAVVQASLDRQWLQRWRQAHPGVADCKWPFGRASECP